MAEDDEDDFGSVYGVNSRRAHLSAYVLVAGLILELINAIIWYKGLETLADMTAVLLIVGGVWGEIFFGHKARIAGDKQLAQYEARASEAQLALEKFKTPRSLSPVQQERITAKMKPFAGMPFDFSIQPDPEPIALMGQIGSTLKAAGLSWEQWHGAPGIPVFNQPGMPQAGIVAFSGLMIQIDDAKTSEWGGAVVTIWDALKAEGVEADAIRITDGTETPNAIHIYIGRKPQ
jgi:hypothetical protein